MRTNERPTGRDVWPALRNGWRKKCPSCGKGAMYHAYLKVNDACPSCGTELHHHRADDAPPYFVMTISGHVVIAGVLLCEKYLSLSPLVEVGIWSAVLVVLSLWLLPRVKGALIGYQWALGMHGFGPGAFEGADLAPADPSAS